MPNTTTASPPKTETIASANAAASTLFIGHNGEWWDSSLILAVVFAAIAGIAVGITTAGSIVSHKREAAASDEALARYKLDTAKDIADANERAADANQKAEQERLDRLRLEASVAPRSIDVAKQQMLAMRWRGLAGKKVSVTSYSLDGEGAGLASQIMATLKAAGVDVEDRRASVMPMGGFSLGVHVTGQDAATASLIRNGIASAGIVVAPSGTPQGAGPTMSMGTPSAATQADVLVGIKPVPTIR